jgi:hypothetical protein
MRLFIEVDSIALMRVLTHQLIEKLFGCVRTHIRATMCWVHYQLPTANYRLRTADCRLEIPRYIKLMFLHQLSVIIKFEAEPACMVEIGFVENKERAVDIFYLKKERFVIFEKPDRIFFLLKVFEPYPHISFPI